jgi:hypothetical protein
LAASSFGNIIPVMSPSRRISLRAPLEATQEDFDSIRQGLSLRL